MFFAWLAAASRPPGEGFSPFNPLGMSCSVFLAALPPLFAMSAKGYPFLALMAGFLSLSLGLVFSEVFLVRKRTSSGFPGESLRMIVPLGMTEGMAGPGETRVPQAVRGGEAEQEFVRIAAPLLDHPVVEKLASYRHHRSASRLEHSIDVAWLSYVAARYLSLDRAAAVRGALLHDLFFYDCAGAGPTLHIFRHPVTSLANARTVTVLSGKEEDIIRKHMWPLTPIPPRYAESWIVCFADTCCSIKDLLLRSKRTGERLFSG